MWSRELPSVLQCSNGNSISTERALKQIEQIIKRYVDLDDETADRVNASLDDIKTMLAAINRGD